MCRMQIPDVDLSPLFTSLMTSQQVYHCLAMRYCILYFSLVPNVHLESSIMFWNHVWVFELTHIPRHMNMYWDLLFQQNKQAHGHKHLQKRTLQLLQTDLQYLCTSRLKGQEKEIQVHLESGCVLSYFSCQHMFRAVNRSESWIRTSEEMYAWHTTCDLGKHICECLQEHTTSIHCWLTFHPHFHWNGWIKFRTLVVMKKMPH